MVFVVSYVRKALSTSLAIIRPNSSVDLHVGFDVVGLAETSPADVTFEWLLSRVDSLMPFEIGVD
jgi:homoserine kinase